MPWGAAEVNCSSCTLQPCHSVPAPRRALLVVAEQNGNHLHECWTEVLRCVSRFELLQQLTAGVPTDALLFAMPADKGASAGSTASKLKQRLLRGRGAKGGEGEDAFAHDSFSSINDMGLHAGGWKGWRAGWGSCEYETSHWQVGLELISAEHLHCSSHSTLSLTSA